MKSKTFLFLTSGFGDNLLTLPLALELEEKTDLVYVIPNGPQKDFFAACLPSARAVSYDRSLFSLLRVLVTGWGRDVWLYPIGACTRKLRLIHLLAYFRPAYGFTSLNSEKSWQAEIGLTACYMPDLAKRAWKNNLRLLRSLGLTTRRLWEDYVGILSSRLSKTARVSKRLVVHIGSARYTGGLEKYKRWPLKRFMSTVEWLLSKSDGKFTDVRWVIGPDDVDLEPELRSLIQASPQVKAMTVVSYLEFTGDLLKMGEFLSSASYMLTNDSGLAHLATLYGVPMTSLTSGLGQPSYTGQNGSNVELIMHHTDCYGCAVGISTAEAVSFRCDHNWACMDGITVETVVDSVNKHC